MSTTEVAPGMSPDEEKSMGGRKTRRGATAKQLKRMLKAAGLKTSGKKAALTKRAKKAHLKLVKKGGADPESTSGTVESAGEPVKGGMSLSPASVGGPVGGRRRSRRRTGKLGVFGL